MDAKRREAKKAGTLTGKAWSRKAPITDVIAIAGVELEYGETLQKLIDEGFKVPASRNADFSLGFVKQVKSYVHNVVLADRRRHRNKPAASGED